MPLDEILLITIFIIVFVSLYLAAWYFEVGMRGVWKFMAILPLTIMFAIPINIMVGTTIDPTSHNLYPIEFILYVLPSFFFWLFVVLLHRNFTKADKPGNIAKD